jgi:hypothetical protein
LPNLSLVLRVQDGPEQANRHRLHSQPLQSIGDIGDRLGIERPANFTGGQHALRHLEG